MIARVFMGDCNGVWGSCKGVCRQFCRILTMILSSRSNPLEIFWSFQSHLVAFISGSQCVTEIFTL